MTLKPLKELPLCKEQEQQGEANSSEPTSRYKFQTTESTVNTQNQNRIKTNHKKYNTLIEKQQIHLGNIYRPLIQKAQETIETITNQQVISNKQLAPLPTKNQQEEASHPRISQLPQYDSSESSLRLNFKKPYVYESEIFVACKYFSFERKTVHLSSLQAILIQDRQLRTADLQKVEISAEAVLSKRFKIELLCKNEKYVFGVELRRQLYQLPQHYLYFAKIINTELAYKGYDLDIKTQQFDQLKQNSTFCEGTIYKRSKYIKKWKERYVVITAQGLFSYINPNENYSVFIQMKDIIKLSTQFEEFQNNLIVILHCLKQKFEFAIPIHDFCLKMSSNWLLAFYRLLMEHKHHIKTA